MIGPELLICYVLARTEAGGSAERKAINTEAALATRFEVVRKLSFHAPGVGEGFAVSVDGELLYFTERRREREETDLMAFDLQRGATWVVTPLCVAPESPGRSGGTCTLPDTLVAGLPGEPRLLVAQAALPQPYSSVFVLDLATDGRLEIQLGQAPRRPLLESNGIDPALGTNGEMQVSPSRKYLLAALQLLEVEPYYAERDYGVFSLGTGKREFLYHVPVRVVGNHEETGGSRAWWEASDVMVVKRWGGKEETIEAFRRDTSGTWEKATLPSPLERRQWWPTVRRSVGDWATVGQDSQDRGGFSIARDVLFGSGPGAIFVVDSPSKTVVLRVRGSISTDTQVDVVVLRQLATPDSS